MGRYQTASPRIRLFDLLFLASVASAVSLSSFKLISSGGLPLACVIAYNTPISGCTNDDFTTGSTCSSTCIEGIKTTEAVIKGACDQVDAADNTILILAMSGRLVDALCPNNGGDDDDDYDDDDNRTTTTARVTTSSTRSTTTSPRGFTTIPSSTTRSASSTSSTPFAADPAQSESSSESTSEATSTTSITSPTSLVTTGDVLTVTSTASPSERSKTTTSAEAAQETDPLDNGGGGSPFDTGDSVSGAAHPGYQGMWWPATLAAALAAGWILAH